MALAPLCKTAIASFIVDEAFKPLWNVSSNMRKRLQMIIEDKDVILKKYNQDALKLNGWVRIGKNSKIIKGVEEIRKGISNYKLKTQQELEKVISLNGKLRCNSSRFEPEVPVEFDYIENLPVNLGNYDFYSECSFNRVSNLRLEELSLTQIKEIMSRIKKINNLWIGSCSMSNLNLSSAKISSITFYRVTFLENFDLPSNLSHLELERCQKVNFLRYKKITSISFLTDETNFENSFGWIKKCKGLKTANIAGKLSTFMDYLPSTIIELGCYSEIDAENIDLARIKEKFPFLINIVNKTPIEMAQKLNLRAIRETVINKTETKFTFRPRRVYVAEDNLEQFNKHPEIFEKVEKIWIFCDGFNFDSLPGGIKEIGFSISSIQGDKPKSLKENNWKFEKSDVFVPFITYEQATKILASFEKVRRVKINEPLEDLKKDYPQFKFITI